MPEYDLTTTLHNLVQIDSQETKLLVLPDACCTPGFWVVITALASHKKYGFHNLQFNNDEQESHSKELGLHLALTNDHEQERKPLTKTSNSSPIVILDQAELIEQANSAISTSIRNSPIESSDSPGLSKLCNVVGELHSNVWDHGESTGFSIVQTSKVLDEKDNYIEFALADCGRGFLREMKSNGHKHVAKDDIEAIKWCLEKGNTTKGKKERDEFAQRVPVDHAGGNPYGSVVPVYYSHGSDNQHQGLGLHKLVEFVKQFSGELVVASGHGILSVSEGEQRNWSKLEYNWPGVAISCRVRESQLNNEDKAIDSDIEEIILTYLGGFSR